jgi:hypothetical protein
MPKIKFKEAKVGLERDKFMLTLGNTKKEIVVGELNDAACVRKLAGKKDIQVAVSGRNIVAIGRRAAPCYWIVCYIPVPDIYKRLRVDIRQQLVNKYVAEGIVDQNFAEELKAGF